MFLLLKLDMLPTNIFNIVGVVILLIAVLACVMQFTRAHVGGSVIAVLLTVILVLGSIYINKTYHVFNRIHSTVVESYSIVSLKDFDKNSIDECKECLFGYNDKVRAEGQIEVLNALSEKLDNDLFLVPYQDWFDMVDALYNGGVDTIVLNEAYRSVIEEQYETFSQDTKVIGTETYETQQNVTIKDVEAVKEPFIVYLAANDDYGTLVSKGRNDVNIIAVVNPIYKKILMVTIPRDSYVYLRFEDGTISSSKDKLTHAGIYGIQTSINTIEDFLGININYYMKINFSGLIDLVDALGGITVDSDFEFTTFDGTHHFVKGTNELDGEDAMYFARERYAFTDGDFQRSRDHIKVINGIIDKALSPVILTNYLGIMNSLEGTFETNVPYEDISALVKMQLESMPNWDIESMNITGKSKYDYCYSMARDLSVVYTDDTDVEQAISLINMYMNMGKTE
jgi:LCP family protein required for cell wall assembly